MLKRRPSLVNMKTSAAVLPHFPNSKWQIKSIEIENSNESNENENSKRKRRRWKFFSNIYFVLFYLFFFFTNYFGHNEFFQIQKIKFINYAL